MVSCLPLISILVDEGHRVVKFVIRKSKACNCDNLTAAKTATQGLDRKNIKGVPNQRGGEFGFHHPAPSEEGAK